MTVTVPAAGGLISLPATQDTIIKAPSVITAPVQIGGGHNIVWIGGEFRFTIPQNPNGGNAAVKFMYGAGNGGVVHLEGLWLDGANGNINDGIVGGQYSNQSVPAGTRATSILQLENIRASVRGNWSINHDDLIQQYGGWKELRIDHFTGSSEGQGFYLPYEDSAANNQGVLSRWDARNFNLSDSLTGAPGETLLHFGDKGGAFNATTHQQRCNMSNGWISTVLRTFRSDVYPNSGTGSTDGTVVHSMMAANGQSQSWAPTWICSGGLNKGTPSGGDFVPLGVAGINYVSPG